MTLQQILTDNARRIDHLSIKAVTHSQLGPTFQVSLMVKGGSGYRIEHDPDPARAILTALVEPVAVYDDLEDLL